MSLHRRAVRRDQNEQAIVDALEAIGATVNRLSGAGLPDLLIEFPEGSWRVLEVKHARSKTGKVRYSKMQQAQNAIRPRWPVVRDVAEALALFGVTDATWQGQAGRLR